MEPYLMCFYPSMRARAQRVVFSARSTSLAMLSHGFLSMPIPSLIMIFARWEGFALTFLPANLACFWQACANLLTKYLSKIDGAEHTTLHPMALCDWLGMMPKLSSISHSIICGDKSWWWSCFFVSVVVLAMVVILPPQASFSFHCINGDFMILVNGFSGVFCHNDGCLSVWFVKE